MSLIYKIKQGFAPRRKNFKPKDDFRILDSWIEYKESDAQLKDKKLNYICYQLETMNPETGERQRIYKAVKFVNIVRLPAMAKQSTSLMEMHRQILSGCYGNETNLVTIIANVLDMGPNEDPLGLFFLYGVQGVAENITDAKRKADADMEGLIGSLIGTYRVLKFKYLNGLETEWLKEKLSFMKFVTVVRGIPYASPSGEDGGNKGLGGKNINPDSQGTLEEIISAMADYEYIIEVISSPVRQSQLTALHRRNTELMTHWYSQLQGTSSLNLNVSIPMMYATNAGASNGWNHNYSDGSNISYGHNTGISNNYSENIGQNIGQSFSESVGTNNSLSVGNTVGLSHTVGESDSVGISHTEGTSETFGVSHGTSTNHGFSLSNTIGENEGTNVGASQNITDGTTTGTTSGTGYSSGSSFGINQGQSSNTGFNEGISTNQNYGVNHSHSLGLNEGTSYGLNRSFGNNVNMGVSEGQNSSISDSVSESQNIGLSNTVGHNQSVSHGQNSSVSNGMSVTDGSTWGRNNGGSENWSFNHGGNFGRSAGYNDGITNNDGGNFSHQNNRNENITGSVGGSIGIPGTGVNGSVSRSNGTGESDGFGTNWGNSDSHAFNEGTSFGRSSSYGYGSGANWSNSFGGSHSVGQNNSVTNGTSNTVSEGISDSVGLSKGMGITNGVSVSNGKSVGSSYSEGYSASMGENIGTSRGTSENVSVGNSISSGYGKSLGASHSTGTSSGISQGLNSSNSLSFSDSLSKSRSMGQGLSQGISSGTSRSVGMSETFGTGENWGESYSQGRSVSDGISITKGTSESWGESKSLSQTKSVGNSHSLTNGTSIGSSYGTSKGTGTSEGDSTSQGYSTSSSLGQSGTYNSGISSSMGLGPSIGYSKAHQWKNQTVEDLLEILTFKNDRLKSSLRQGAFYTYCYLCCPTQQALDRAMVSAGSTWQNEHALAEPLQVLNLTPEEQSHVLYHAAAFSADVSRIEFAGEREPKYRTMLLPDELNAFTHLPRISEGGIFAEIMDIPHFAVPSRMKGDIYIGTIINAEIWTPDREYYTKWSYRLDETSLMHTIFTGASRSGKTVAAMRFIAELANIRRSKTNKRLRIVCLDPKRDWRGISKYVDASRFHFYSLANPKFHAIKLNVWKIPYGVRPQLWVDGIIDIYCRAYGLLERGKQMIAEVVYSLYKKYGVFDVLDEPNWEELVPERSKNVCFKEIYEEMEKRRDQFCGNGKGGNDTKDAYARLLERLSAFAREYSIEHQLFGLSDGIGIDEMIGADDVTVIESKGLENTFKNFMFGAITDGFYKYAQVQKNGFLSEDQYETVLVIEEANEVLTGSDTASSKNDGASLSGESAFEVLLDQAAGFGLFIVAITQKISQMPSSLIANVGIKFIGRLNVREDIEVAGMCVGEETRFEDRDFVKWMARSPIGWFICQSSRGFSYEEAEPVMVKVKPLDAPIPSDEELNEILLMAELAREREK